MYTGESGGQKKSKYSYEETTRNIVRDWMDPSEPMAINTIDRNREIVMCKTIRIKVRPFYDKLLFLLLWSIFAYLLVVSFLFFVFVLSTRTMKKGKPQF